MNIKNKRIVLSYRLIFVLICGYGLYLNLFNGQSIQWAQLRYYTLLSNVLCEIYMLSCLIKEIRGFRAWNTQIQSEGVVLAHLKGAITLCILVTFLIFHFLLAGGSFSMGSGAGGAYLNSLSNRIVHYVVPLMFVLDWLLFDVKGTYTHFDPVKWIVIPYVYLAYALIRGAVGGAVFHGGSKYPYFFLDGPKIGWFNVFAYVAVLTIFFVILGYVIYGIDYRLGKLSNKK